MRETPGELYKGLVLRDNIRTAKYINPPHPLGMAREGQRESLDKHNWRPTPTALRTTDPRQRVGACCVWPLGVGSAWGVGGAGGLGLVCLMSLSNGLEL